MYYDMGKYIDILFASLILINHLTYVYVCTSTYVPLRLLSIYNLLVSMMLLVSNSAMGLLYPGVDVMTPWSSVGFIDRDSS